MNLLLLAGCGLFYAENDLSYECDREEVSVDTVAPPVEEADVWALAEGFAPVRAVWSEYSADGAPESSARWSLTRGRGDVVTVSYSGEEWCPTTTALGIPVELEVELDDGAATQTWSTTLEATGATLAEMSLYETSVLTDDKHAQLSDQWTEACAEVDQRDWGTLDEAWITWHGTFDALQIDVEGGRTTADARSWGACWSGYLLEEGDSVPADTGG